MRYSMLLLMMITLFLKAPVFAATITYEYDELDRLHVTTLENGGKITYSYDKIGNITSKIATGLPPAAAPIVSAISPASGSTSGGESITITGSNFVAGATVSFGGSVATNVTVVGSTSIIATTPAHAAGAVAVTVTNPGNLGATLPSGYNYTGGSAVYSIFPANAVPAVASYGDDLSSLELGMRFTSAMQGQVTGIRYYKSAENTGTHIGSLWSGDGALLARVTFSDESVSGWQQANFTAPVTIIANATYVVSYHTNTGHYAVDINYFTTARTSGPLTAPASSVGSPNGVFDYGSDPLFPTLSFNNNYWVDVVFTTAAAPTVSAVSPTTGSTSGGETVTITGSNFIAGATVSFGGSLATNVTVVGSTSITATTPAHTAGTVTVTVTNPDGVNATLVNGYTYTAVAANTYSIFPTNATPAVAGYEDSSSVELGMKFTSTTAGQVTGVRYYKSASNTGTHTGSLWSDNGSLLAQVTFTGESSTGWQQANFTTPVPIAANTTYVISYHTNTGYYAVDTNYFTNALTNGPLTAPASSTGSPNGVFAYSSNPAFPASSFNNCNYWVDVVFTPTAATYSLFPVNVTPAVAGHEDASPVELGMKFSSTTVGQITGIRYYKSASNTGTHTGSLWSDNGTLLARVTFADENDTGWQQANFSTPVPIAANTTYVISYHTNTGHYAVDENYFTTARTNGPLTAPASSTASPNGVFTYGANPIFPTSGFNNNNYWVDVVWMNQ